MPERETQETEVTLGTGKLLGIFLGLAVLCSVFFTLGYMLGRSNASASAKTEVVPTGSSNGNAAKPSAGNKPSEPAPQTSTAASVPNPADTSANKPQITQTTPNIHPQSPQTTVAVVPNSSPASTKTSAPPTLPAASTKNPPAGSYMVQVAAVSKQEDADILVAALRRKQYPVFVVANNPGDALFHIQVGPFPDAKEAEAMRVRLVNDGYNAIVKK